MLDPRLQTALVAIEHHYDSRLIAVALFGSRVGRRARAESDWDLLLVVGESEPIRRTLYREWDAAIAPSVERFLPGIAPHFVHLPEERDEPSGFWLEIAMSHVILRDPTGRLASYLGRVRRLVETGQFERRAVHGCGYWRRAG
jgi:predicted nucleotidyltransferase